MDSPIDIIPITILDPETDDEYKVIASQKIAGKICPVCKNTLNFNTFRCENNISVVFCEACDEFLIFQTDYLEELWKENKE